MNRTLMFLIFLIAVSFLFAAPVNAQYTIFYWDPTDGANFNTVANWSGGDPTLAGGKVFWVQGTTPVEITSTPIYPADPIYTMPIIGGTVNQSDGDVVVTPYQTISGGGTYNMTGGTYWAKGMQEFFSVGRTDGSGTLNVSGGNFKIDPSTVYGWGISMTIANPNQATGTVSGSATVSKTGVIDCQTGFVSLCTNGVLNIGDQTNTGVAGGTLKSWNLIGEYYYGSTGGGILNFDGGTWVCTRDASPGYLFFELSQVNLLAGGGTIEVLDGLTAKSDGNNGVAAISGVGALTKTGEGTLILANTTNTYAGATTIQGGTLALNNVSIASGSITVKNTATLAGSTDQTTLIPYPETTVESGGTIAPGSVGPALLLSKLNLGNNANLHFTIDANRNVDLIEVQGDISRLGPDPITVNVAYTGVVQQITPILSIPAGCTGSLDTQINFTIGTVLDSNDGKTKPVTISKTTGANGSVALNPGGDIDDPAWNTTASGATWNTPGSWSPATVPNSGGKRAMFTGHLDATDIHVNLDTSPQVSSMIFDSPEGQSYTITPTSSDKYIKLHSTMADNWHISVLGGAHIIDANLHLGKGTDQSAIRLADNSHLTLSRVLSDEITSPSTPAGINVEGNFNMGFLGNGVLTLSGGNTFTGPIGVNNSILEIASIGDTNTDNTLGRSAPIPANFKLNGTLRYIGADATPSSNRGFTATAATGSNSNLEIQNSSTNLTLSGEVRSTSGGLQKTGPGSATFTNAGASNVLASEGFTVSQGGVAFNGGTASVYQVIGNTIIDTASSLSISSGKLQSGGYIQAQNGSTETISGSSQIVAAGFGLVNGSSATLSGTATILSTASVGVHTGSVLNLNSTGVIPDDFDGYTVKSSNLLAVGFDTPGTTGAVNITAGKVFAPILWLGNESGNLGSLNISGTGTFVTTATALGSLNAGANGVGYISIKGGTLKPSYALDTMYIGLAGDGLLDVSAGTMDCTATSAGSSHPGDALWIGSGIGVPGILNVRGTGSVANTTNVIRMRSGGMINVGVSGDAHGVLQTAAIVPAPQAAGSEARVGIVNFHGGTLTATVDADGVTIPEGGTTANPVLLGNGVSDIAHAYVYAEGAKIDTNGHNAVIDAPLEALAAGGVYSTATATPLLIPMQSGANGSGYITTPYVKVLDGDGTGPGTGATAIAVMSIANPDQVDHIQITNPGVGYANPTFTLVGGLGSAGVAAAIDAASITTGANASGGLSKLGSGKLTLTGALSYAGNTAISAGTLQINTPGATSLSTLTDAGNLTVGSGTIATELTFTGATSGAGTATISAGSTLQLVSSGASSLGSISGNGTIAVRNGVLTTASIRVGTLSIGSAAAAASAVPEPGTFTLLAVALTTIAGMWRKYTR